MKKHFKIAISILLLLANIFCLFIIPSVTLPVAAPQQEGAIVVTVLEHGTNKPIDNATICIIETKEYFSTNKNGVSEKINLPIIKNTTLSNSLNQNWGEVTVLVYKAGYSDHILFSEPVPINKTRYGLIVYLHPIYSTSDTAPTITTNKPNIDWVKELIKIYKKYA